VIAALVVLGIIAQIAAWHLARIGRLDTWMALGWVFVVLGLVCILTGEVELWGSFSPWEAAGAGLLSALVLFAFTRLFLQVARVWSRFAADTDRLYADRGKFPVALAVVIAAVVASGEEMFWRGVVQGSLVEVVGTWGAAGASLLGYALVSLAAGSVPITVASIVAGAVWSALTAWSGGVAAAVVCHSVWTGLMIALPPRHLWEEVSARG